RFLERDADALPQGLVVLSPALAENLDFARGRRQQSFEDFDCGGLARAVGTQQTEALTAAHLEIEASDGIDRIGAAGIALAQVAAQDRRGHANDYRKQGEDAERCV